MFKMSIAAQQGMKFNAHLLKGEQVVGGIGGDGDGMYINVNEKLTLDETYQILKFAKGVHPLFLTLPLVIHYKS